MGVVPGFEFIPYGHWPTDVQPIAAMRADVAELARRHNTRVIEWWEDGLGPARAIGGRLPSGAMFAITEFRDPTTKHWIGVVQVEVDLATFIDWGAPCLLAEITDALDVPPDAVGDVIDSAGRQAAKSRLD